MASEGNQNHQVAQFRLHSAQHRHKCVFTEKQSKGKRGRLSLPAAENSLLLLPAEPFDVQAVFVSCCLCMHSVIEIKLYTHLQM